MASRESSESFGYYGAGELLPPTTAASFRRRLMDWYRGSARELPWRGVNDPYRTWVSEIMLQQTRVVAVIAHYHEFLRRFPTLVSLALAPEDAVLAAWSGLGYYRRARMMHKAAQFILRERGGVLPSTAVELRTLPGDRRVYVGGDCQHRVRREHCRGGRQRGARAASHDGTAGRGDSRGQVAGAGAGVGAGSAAVYGCQEQRRRRP